MERETAEVMVVLYVLTRWFAPDVGEAWYVYATNNVDAYPRHGPWSLFWWSLRLAGDPRDDTRERSEWLEYLRFKMRTRAAGAGGEDG